MALVFCPDCGKEYSSRAKACPNCGCPNDEQAELDRHVIIETTKEERKEMQNIANTKVRASIWIELAIRAIIILATFFICSRLGWY